MVKRVVSNEICFGFVIKIEKCESFSVAFWVIDGVCRRDESSLQIRLKFGLRSQREEEASGSSGSSGANGANGAAEKLHEAPIGNWRPNSNPNWKPGN